MSHCVICVSSENAWRTASRIAEGDVTRAADGAYKAGFLCGLATAHVLAEALTEKTVLDALCPGHARVLVETIADLERRIA